MGTGLLLALLAFTAAVVVTGEPLKKEVLNLPPLIHFTDVFNTQSDLEHDELAELSGRPQYPGGPQYPPGGPQRPSQPGGPQYPPQHPNYPHNPPYHPHYPQYPGSHNPHYPQYPQYPQYPGGPQYPPSRPYPQNPQPTYPQYPHYPPYPQQTPYPPYPQYPQPHRPRQQDVELVERYCKFNEDGSKEYKLVLSNGLTIYQKVMNKREDKQEIQLLEGYYSDLRDNNTYLTTYFRADDTGYTASSEISDTPPNYPDTKGMLSLPLPSASNTKADKE